MGIGCGRILKEEEERHMREEEEEEEEEEEAVRTHNMIIFPSF